MADKVLTEQIDGRSKDELFKIAAILHDLGKFDRLFKVKDGTETNLPTHTGHEAKAADYILNDDYVHNLLAHDYGLTEDQIKYIAECTRLHYELGKIRKVAKQSEEGYTLAFAKTDKCKEACKEIANQFPDFKVEVGILFMCDSMAKTDVVVNGATDEEIEAVKQGPVNNAMAKTYFEVLKESNI